MSEQEDTILMVDDEPLILRSYQRNLGDRFSIMTAEGPELALSAMRSGRFAVILTDLKMPAMDGIQLLQHAQKFQPDAVRMMISGHADMEDAINSVNRGGIFRLMLKPCPTDDIAASLEAGLRQHRLLTAEKALLEGTLNGAIQALTDILGIMDAEAFGRAQLRRQLARELALKLEAPVWEFEIAAQLADVGRATLPASLNEKIKTGAPLNEAERRLTERVPEFSARLLGKIPRIDGIVAGLMYQNKHYNGRGFPEDSLSGEDIPLAGRALHAIKALLEVCAKGTSPEEAVGILKMGPEKFDPKIVHALFSTLHILQQKEIPGRKAGPQQVSVAQLAAEMTLMADIRTKEGMMVLAAGTRLTELHVQRVRNFAQLNPLAEPFLVETP